MKDEIVLYRPNEQFQLEVQLKDETVWLNVNQIALLFDRDRTVISRHIRNIYKEGELDENITCAKFAHMGMDADQVYETTYYNLDCITRILTVCNSTRLNDSCSMESIEPRQKGKYKRLCVNPTIISISKFGII